MESPNGAGDRYPQEEGGGGGTTNVKTSLHTDQREEAKSRLQLGKSSRPKGEEASGLEPTRSQFVLSRREGRGIMWPRYYEAVDM
jgi:hypothetical protein